MQRNRCGGGCDEAIRDQDHRRHLQPAARGCRQHESRYEGASGQGHRGREGAAKLGGKLRKLYTSPAQKRALAQLLSMLPQEVQPSEIIGSLVNPPSLEPALPRLHSIGLVRTRHAFERARLDGRDLLKPVPT